jgi:hypothetical protein
MTVDIIVCLSILFFILMICISHYRRFSETERLEAQIEERRRRR